LHFSPFHISLLPLAYPYLYRKEERKSFPCSKRFFRRGSSPAIYRDIESKDRKGYTYLISFKANLINQAQSRDMSERLAENPSLAALVSAMCGLPHFCQEFPNSALLCSFRERKDFARWIVKWALLRRQKSSQDAKLTPELPNFKKDGSRQVVSLFRKDASGARLAPSISTLRLPFWERRNFIRRFASLWNQHFAIVGNCQSSITCLYSLISHFSVEIWVMMNCYLSASYPIVGNVQVATLNFL